MAKKRDINDDQFQQLLKWLDADPERAGQKYESIRRSLIRIFLHRGYGDAEDMADETIDRAMGKVDKVQPGFVGDPASYFYSIGNYLMMERAKRRRNQLPLEAASDKLSSYESSLEVPGDDWEQESDCLSICLQKLEPKDRALIESYYQENKRARIEGRKKLAEELGTNLNALRVRAWRIRAFLEDCIEECLKRGPE